MLHNLCVQAFHLEYLRSGEPGKQGPNGGKKLRGTMDRLLRLAKDETLREELTGFALAADSDDAIPAAHRPGMDAPHPVPDLLVHAVPAIKRASSPAEDAAPIERPHRGGNAHSKALLAQAHHVQAYQQEAAPLAFIMAFIISAAGVSACWTITGCMCVQG